MSVLSATTALDRLVADTATGRFAPGVRRCVLRVENPTWPDGWTAAATTHRDDHNGLDADAAFRIASVTSSSRPPPCWCSLTKAVAGWTTRLVSTWREASSTGP